MNAARTRPAGAPRGDAGREHLLTWTVFLVYLVLAIAVTWPVAGGLATDVPADLGDSLLNMWILSWDAEQLRRLFTGEFSVLWRWFDGNIFYPAPDSLAYSEHLFAQALQIFPVYLATRNPILCYNLLFLSTYALSGLGTYLLARELTGDRRAAFVAGLIFAFVPYRIGQMSHLQVLSSQWMPFTLYGFARYLNTGRRRALAGGAGALLLQSLSCGYFLIYFSPFAVGYVLWELTRRKRLGDQRAWLDFIFAAVVVGLAVTPFLIPYSRVQSSVRLARRIGEVSLYSADVYAYFTAFPTERFWGPLLQVMPRAEGELFMGAVPLALAATTMMLVLVHAWRSARTVTDPRPAISITLAATTLMLFMLALAVLFTGRLSIDLFGTPIRIGDIGRLLLWTVIAATLWLIASTRIQAALRASFTTATFFLLSIVVVWWLSLGPFPKSYGRSVAMPAPYNLLYALPGVDGVRVPARMAMVMALMLAVVAAYALARLPRSRRGTLVTATVAGLFLFEAPASEVPINGLGRTTGHALPEARVYPPDRMPAAYRTVAGLPGPAVLLEMPLGDFTWDARAVYYAAAHWRPLVNGYSGFFPPHYGGLVSRLIDPDRDPDAAWQAVRDSGATHVLVHERAYRPPEVEQLRRWLTSGGAREVTTAAGDDILFDVRRP